MVLRYNPFLQGFAIFTTFGIPLAITAPLFKIPLKTASDVKALFALYALFVGIGATLLWETMRFALAVSPEGLDCRSPWRGSSSGGRRYAMSRFAAGQLWDYHTRPSDDGSRIRVLRVDVTPHAGVIVHIAVEGVWLPNPNGERSATIIGFMPVAEASLEQSVTQLVEEDATFVPAADFVEGYQEWKQAFDAGQAGIWTTPVARAMQGLEDGMKQRS
jgi:hypothetical protein